MLNYIENTSTIVNPETERKIGHILLCVRLSLSIITIIIVISSAMVFNLIHPNIIIYNQRNKFIQFCSFVYVNL